MSHQQKSTCQELQKELWNFRSRFFEFFEKQRFSPVVGLTQSIPAYQGFVEESEKLCAEARALREKLVSGEVVELLQKMEEQYEDAKETALEFSAGVEIPSKELVMTKIWGLGLQKLREITKFGKATLLMTPPTTMAEKQKVLDKKKRYPEQADAYFAENANDKLWDPKFPTLTVSIVDGAPTLPQLPDEILKNKNGKLTRWDFRYKKIYEQFKAKNMWMITAHEYAILMQLSLKNYRKAKDDPQHKNHLTSENEIVDFCDDNWQYTALYQSENVLINMKKVPFGYFNSGDSRMYFVWSDPEDEDGDLRFRRSVQVFRL